MDYKLIANLTPTITLLADNMNYILVIRNNPNQVLRNGRPRYFSSIEGWISYLLEYSIRFNLADGQDKTMAQIAENIQATRNEIKRLVAPFEQISLGQ